MKRIMLIYPKTGIDPVIPQPPHSLLSLASVLEKEGYKPIIIDQRVDELFKDHINSNLKDTLCVCISSMTGYQIKHALTISQHIKTLNKNMKVIWGGSHPTLFPLQTLKHPLVDIILEQEAELTLPQVIKRIEENKNLEGIPNVSFKDSKGNLVVNERDNKQIDLNKLPPIPWHLIDLEKYIRPDIGVKRTTALVTSRGCPYRCGFCYINDFYSKERAEKRWRGRDAKYVVDEMERLKNGYNIEGFEFSSEDLFFANPLRVEEICNEIIKRNLNIVWASTCRVDIFSRLSDQFLEKVKKAGLKHLVFGIESGSPRILKLIDKDIILNQVYKTNIKCKKIGITAHYTFMSGLPTENEEDLKMTIDLIDNLKKDNPSAIIGGIFTYSIYPGTPLYNLSLKAGFKPPESLEDWSDYTFFTAIRSNPWLNEKGRRLRKHLGLIARFIFYDTRVKRSIKNRFEKVAYEVLRISGRLRWRYRFFVLPLEWIALEKYYKISSATTN